MSLARSARLLGRAWQSAAGQQQQQQQQHAAAGLRSLLGTQTRAFAGHHGGDAGEYVTYAGLSLKKAPFWEYAASKAIGGFMWFWVFYMTYNNWEHKVYGLPYIFEKEGLDDDEEHGHGHGHH